MKLVICEKPSVGRDIAKILGATQKHAGYISGNGWNVTWAMGHLAELSKPQKYSNRYKSWNLNFLPCIPEKFEFELDDDSGKQKQFKIIKSLLEKCELVVNAADCGREGELIFYYIYKLANVKKPVKRLWIDAIVDDEVKKGFSNLLEGNDKRYLLASAILRAEADWLIGINGTMAYTAKYGGFKNIFSTGRVQTPVLNLIVERKREIENFVPVPYWCIVLTLDNNALFKWYKNEKNSEGKFVRNIKIDEKKEAEKIVDNIKNKQCTIKKITLKKKTQNPPLLYDLTALQKDANKYYGFTAKKTLMIVQNLYEKGFLTYPRTDSRYLPTSLVPDLLKHLNSLKTHSFFSKFLSECKITPKNRIFNDKKISDHYAIIVTTKPFDESRILGDDKKIYDMVASIFLAQGMKPYLFSETTVLAEIQKEKFYTIGKMQLDEGWKILLKIVGSQKKTQKKDENNELPLMKKDEIYNQKHLELIEKQTTPPKYFNEASLLSAMETCGKTVGDEELRDALKEKGLGTPATRAGIIEKLISIKYIQRKGKNFLPLPKGEKLIDLINIEELKSAELTGIWEYKLKQVEKGEFKTAVFRKEIIDFTNNLINNIKNNSLTLNQNIVCKCPECNSGSLIENKNGYFCSLKNCDFKVWKNISGKILSSSEVKELLENKILKNIEFTSKKNKKFTTDLVLIEKNGKLEIQFGFQIINKIEKLKCPKCKTGSIISDSDKFYCENINDCKFVFWKKVGKKNITIDEFKNMIELQKIGPYKLYNMKNKCYYSYLELDEKFKLKRSFITETQYIELTKEK